MATTEPEVAAAACLVSVDLKLYRAELAPLGAPSHSSYSLLRGVETSAVLVFLETALHIFL